MRLGDKNIYFLFALVNTQAKVFHASNKYLKKYCKPTFKSKYKKQKFLISQSIFTQTT